MVNHLLALNLSSWRLSLVLNPHGPCLWLDLNSLLLQNMVEQKKAAVYYTYGTVYQYGELLSINICCD